MRVILTGPASVRDRFLHFCTGDCGLLRRVFLGGNAGITTIMGCMISSSDIE